MKISRFSLLLAGLLLVMPLAAQVNDSEPADPAPGPQEAWLTVKKPMLAWGSTDERYSRSQVPQTAGTAALYAWKGERVNAHAVVYTPADIASLSFSVTDLKCGKKLIPSSCVEKYFGRYVLTSYNKSPDLTLSEDRLDPAESMSVAANTTRPLWISVNVPADAAPGKYKGSLQADCDGTVLSIPFTLEVADKVLPPSAEWSFHLDLWQNPYAVARYYQVPLWSDEHFALMRPVMEKYASAGGKVITASIIQHPWNCQTFDPFESMIGKFKHMDGSWSYDYTVFDKWVEFMFSCGVTGQIDCYSLVPWTYIFDYYDCGTNAVKLIKCKPVDPEYGEFFLPFLKDFAAHLKARGWFDKTCIAMDERPMEDLHAAWDVVHAADPEFRIEGAAKYYPTVEPNMFDLCIYYRDPITPSEVIERRRSEGKFTTFYTCCGPVIPNTFTFSKPAESAFLGWYAMAGGYDGYLRWALNSWTEQPNQDSLYGKWPAGDCYLLYPGCTSIRFERLIEGIQAYTKMQILRRTASEESLAALDSFLEKIKPNIMDDPEYDYPGIIREGNAILKSMK